MFLLSVHDLCGTGKEALDQGSDGDDRLISHIDDTQSAVQYRRGEDFIYLMERETLYLGGTLLRSGTLSQICDRADVVRYLESGHD